MTSTMEVIKVGIADMNTVKAPQLIRTSGLGSCVGVVIYDDLKKIAGLAHVMLPESSLAREQKLNKAKYADTAITELIDMLLKMGANKSHFRAKLAGGAQMFTFSGSSDLMRIGPRNVEAVKKELARFNIRIISEDTGGSSGRTIEFNPETALLNIRTVHKGTAEI
ncbi:chemotaxis protein CheD [Cytobacillus gottheilii]|uniref:chemotaxis protein CheD n=1 Tax=Cytobacillus gottheilii TaxID=859144 RepID=UPI0009BA449A|nr:chemotaxis protein CheD [Cytobacillus gottheilii]